MSLYYEFYVYDSVGALPTFYGITYHSHVIESMCHGDVGFSLYECNMFDSIDAVPIFYNVTLHGLVFGLLDTST